MSLARITIGFAALLLAASGAPAVDGQQLAGQGALSEQQRAMHVLDRLAFGPRPGEIERVRSLGVDRWIRRQLDPERIDDREMDRRLDRARLLRASPDALRREYPPPEALIRNRRDRRDDAMSAGDSTALREAAMASRRPLLALQTAKVARAVASERQLEEVMADFWANHFSVFAGKGPIRYYLPEYDHAVIRRHALGRFRDLLGAVARHPAMLFYLDNWQSAADSGRRTLAPRPLRARRLGRNENYARELLELHTLGVDGGYTQHDVIEVARAFTGWTIENPRGGGAFIFRPQLHDAEEKVVLGVRLPAGQGLEDGERVLDLLAAHPSTARFIAFKLARRLVSDDPPAALVDRAAATFTRTGGDLREVVRTVVTSPEFFSPEAYRAKVKSPFELVVSAVRALGGVPDTTPRTARVIARLGQPLFARQSPDGYPDTGPEWLGAGAMIDRINIAMAIGSGRFTGVSLERWARDRRLAGGPPATQRDRVIAALFPDGISPESRSVLSPAEGERPAPLPQVVGLALGVPEFQRR